MDSGFARQTWGLDGTISHQEHLCCLRWRNPTRLEDWVGNSSGAVNRGGCPQRHPRLPTGGARGAAADSAATRPRGRPAKATARAR